MKRRVGVIADDITGANDIGSMFSKNGFSSVVIPLEKLAEAMPAALAADVVVADTDSRFDSPVAAAEKARRAAEALKRIGFDMYHNKTCSVFRGNIGAEFDAVQDVLGTECSMVVLGLPKLGRTTVDGVHYLNGVRLNKSAFANDPVHPTMEASLQKILAKQSARPSAVFNARMLDMPCDRQAELLAKMKKEYAYIIFDVRGQQDLKTVAALIKDELNICGSSGIAEELPGAWGQRGPDAGAELIAPDEGSEFKRGRAPGTLILAGSLTEATRGQTEFLINEGCPFFTVNPEELLNGRGAEAETEAVTKAVLNIARGKTFLVRTENNPERVKLIKAAASREGLSGGAFGKMISETLGRIAKHTAAESGCKRIVTAGGDTSKAVSAALGISHMFILRELEPGLPAMYGYGDFGKMPLVLKSGSFGSPEFLSKAVTALSEL